MMHAMIPNPLRASTHSVAPLVECAVSTSKQTAAKPSYQGYLHFSNMPPYAVMLSYSIPVRIFAALLVFTFTLVCAAPLTNVTINLRSFTSHSPSEQNCL
jgi:hypothetical protein